MEKYQADFYEVGDLHRLLKVAKDSVIEVPIILAVYYGLRRSEVVGLKWSSIDFERKTLEIRSTVVRAATVIRENNTKSESSHRILPLLPQIENALKQLQEQQEKDKLLLGSAYENTEYVFRWADGHPMEPSYLSRQFKKLLKNNGLRNIRFHDLRHSCASLLIDMGYSIKVVQEILGHSDYNTTANIYGHLTKKIETKALNSIASALGI